MVDMLRGIHSLRDLLRLQALLAITSGTIAISAACQAVDWNRLLIEGQHETAISVMTVLIKIMLAVTVTAITL